MAPANAKLFYCDPSSTRGPWQHLPVFLVTWGGSDFLLWLMLRLLTIFEGKSSPIICIAYNPQFNFPPFPILKSGFSFPDWPLSDGDTMLMMI